MDRSLYCSSTHDAFCLWFYVCFAFNVFFFIRDVLLPSDIIFIILRWIIIHLSLCAPFSALFNALWISISSTCVRLKNGYLFCATQIIHEDGSSAREDAPLPSARLPGQFQQVGNSKSPKWEAQINKQRSRFFVSFDTSRFFLGCVCLTIFAFPFRDLFVRLKLMLSVRHLKCTKSCRRVKTGLNLPSFRVPFGFLWCCFRDRASTRKK